ncbi:MAG: hypothetical protein DRQ46_10615 [Gammaproteobacteria bacterium]|nr:MAG: hypothetical protein DRQ46_10615 [Gammaproteobacteria bacterium]
MGASATFVIDFGSIEDAYLVAELDEIKNGGKTSFVKGDSVHFRISADVDYEIETSAGLVSNPISKDNLNSPVDEPVENEVLTFVKGESPGTSKYIKPTVPVEDAITAETWYGNNLGQIRPTGTTNVQAANADTETLGIASITYVTEYYEHELTAPASMTDVYHILVYIKAVA